MVVSLLILLFSAGIPILVILGIIYVLDKVVANKKVGRKMTEEEGENMLKNIYTYLVLFATLMMTIGGSVGVFMGIADYVIPQPYVETYENYRMTYGNNTAAYPMQEENDTGALLDESNIRENYDLMVKDAKENEQQMALKLIIQSIGWIIIPFPIFLYFQKQVSVKKDTVTE